MTAPVLIRNETSAPVRRLWIALLIALLPLASACHQSTGAATASIQAGQSQLPQELQRKPGEGEQCIVCDQPITGGEVVELRYKGRRFYVAAPLLQDLFDDPDRYFYKRQARSALFDEEAHTAIASNGWLYFGLYVLAGLLFGALCGYLAITRAMPPLPWFFAGLLGNLAALLVLLGARRGDPSAHPAGVPPELAKVPATRAPIACAKCGRLNHPAATVCVSCLRKLQPKVGSEASRALHGGES